MIWKRSQHRQLLLLSVRLEEIAHQRRPQYTIVQLIAVLQIFDHCAVLVLAGLHTLYSLVHVRIKRPAQCFYTLHAEPFQYSHTNASPV